MKGRAHRTAIRLSAFAGLALAGACGTDASQIAGPGPDPSALKPRLLTTPTPSQVVVSPSGAFRSFLANNSGRATTEFWDNFSKDNLQTNLTCNAGFYAGGTMGTPCDNTSAGSLANQGGYSQMFGTGTNNYAPAAFMFSGAYAYNLKLEGSFTALPSNVGFFYIDGAGYHFQQLTDISSRAINSTTAITPAMTGGHDWGFYISNTFNPQASGCGPTGGGHTFCSNATGGFESSPYQQWALFLNAGGTKYLVGAEDNRLGLLATADPEDSDYNDYLISVSPVVVVAQGCSPGFWKNTNDANWAKAGVNNRNASFQSVFGTSAFAGMSLQQVLEQGGGGINALGRQVVSAYLNAGAIGSINYGMTQAQVIAAFQAAYASGNYSTLQSQLEGMTDVNGRTCPLNNGKNS